MKVKDYMHPADQRDEVLEFVEWLADKSDTSDFCGFDEVVDEPEDTRDNDLLENFVYQMADK